jgi:formylglycine-generating enzyme required for sulfatase activity
MHRTSHRISLQVGILLAFLALACNLNISTGESTTNPDQQIAVAIALTQTAAAVQSGSENVTSLPPTAAETTTITPTQGGPIAQEPTELSDDPVMALALAGVSSNSEWQPYTKTFESVPMALVPAGCFQMGSNSGDPDEQPVHEVCYEQPFWIDVYEVTNAQYGAIQCYDTSPTDDHPSNCVEWDEAVVHCEKRNARLPTEAEWEYAVRGADGLMYPWGNEWHSTYTVWNTNKVSVVGTKPQGVSWVGAYDLLGSMWEWVSDWYGPYANGKQINPQGRSSGAYHVMRGASWNSIDPYNFRATNRPGGGPNEAFTTSYGFRCARDADPE